MKFENPIIVCGAHGGGTSLATKVLRLNGLFAGVDAGDALGKRDDEQGKRVLHESDAMVKINCTALKNFLPYTNDTEMMHLSTWNFYLSVLENSDAIKIVFEKLSGDGLNASQLMGGVNPAWGNVQLEKCLSEFWGGEPDYSKPWGWKDPRNSAAIPLWKLAFKKPKFLFLEREERSGRKHNSPSGRWFCEEFTGKLRDYYYCPPFLEEDDDTHNIGIELLLKDVDAFNSTMEWAGLKRLDKEEFDDLMKKADVKYEKL